MIEQDYRPITNREKAILLRLLELNFRGRDAIREQVGGLLGKQIDNEGSLSLKVTSKTRADIPGGIAVEARYSDSEAVDPWEPHVNLLLHIADGQIKLLEVYKDDGSPIRRMPDPEELQLFSQHEIRPEG